MRPSELGLWVARWQTDPWGERRADERAAIVALTIAKSHLRKQGGAWRLEDFMLHPAAVSEPPDHRTLSAAIRAAFGGPATGPVPVRT